MTASFEFQVEDRQHPGDPLKVVAGRHRGHMRELLEVGERTAAEIQHPDPHLVRPTLAGQIGGDRAEQGRLAGPAAAEDQKAAVRLEVDVDERLPLLVREVGEADRHPSPRVALVGLLALRGAPQQGCQADLLRKRLDPGRAG